MPSKPKKVPKASNNRSYRERPVEPELGKILSNGASSSSTRKKASKFDEQERPTFRSKRPPMHKTVTSLRQTHQRPGRTNFTQSPSPAPSSDIGLYDHDSDEDTSTIDIDGIDEDDDNIDIHGRNRSLSSVGDAIAQQMTDKTARYLAAYIRNKNPFASSVDQTAVINACWARCQRNFGNNRPITGRIKSNLRVKMGNVRSHLLEKTKRHILDLYDLTRLNAEERMTKVNYLLEQMRYLRRSDGYENGHWRFLAPQISDIIYLKYFSSKHSPGRIDPMAWLDRTTPTTIAFVCTTLFFSLSLYKRTGIEEKTSSGVTTMKFTGKPVLDTYSAVCSHWSEMSQNMKAICMTQIKKAVLAKIDGNPFDETASIQQPVRLPEDAEAKMMAEFGEDSLLIATRKAAKRARSESTTAADLSFEDEDLYGGSPLVAKTRKRHRAGSFSQHQSRPDGKLNCDGAMEDSEEEVTCSEDEFVDEVDEQSDRDGIMEDHDEEDEEDVEEEEEDEEDE